MMLLYDMIKFAALKNLNTQAYQPPTIPVRQFSISWFLLCIFSLHLSAAANKILLFTLELLIFCPRQQTRNQELSYIINRTGKSTLV